LETKSKDLLISPNETLYSDPIGASTRKSGWFLTIMSFVTIIVFVFKLKPTQIFGVTFESPPKVELFAMIASSLVVALLIPYSIKVVVEFLRKKEIDHLLAVNIADRKEAWLRKRAREKADSFNHGADYHEQLQEDAEFYHEAFAHREKSNLAEEQAMRKILKATLAKFIREFRFWTTLCTPICLAILALWIAQGPLLNAFSLIRQSL
jgi:branched-subunit amino acid transport protein AzlD